MDINNTLIIPNAPLSCTAGKNVSFTIETRTTNPNLVTIGWDLDITKDVVLLTTQDKPSNLTYLYSVARGDKRGRYVATIQCFKAYPQNNTNNITI